MTVHAPHIRQALDRCSRHKQDAESAAAELAALGGAQRALQSACDRSVADVQARAAADTSNCLVPMAANFTITTRHARSCLRSRYQSAQCVCALLSATKIILRECCRGLNARQCAGRERGAQGTRGVA